MSTVTTNRISGNSLPIPEVDGINKRESIVAGNNQTVFTLTEITDVWNIRAFIGVNEVDCEWTSSTQVTLASPAALNQIVHFYTDGPASKGIISKDEDGNAISVQDLVDDIYTISRVDLPVSTGSVTLEHSVNRCSVFSVVLPTLKNNRIYTFIPHAESFAAATLNGKPLVQVTSIGTYVPVRKRAVRINIECRVRYALSIDSFVVINPLEVITKTFRIPLIDSGNTGIPYPIVGMEDWTLTRIGPDIYRITHGLGSTFLYNCYVRSSTVPGREFTITKNPTYTDITFTDYNGNLQTDGNSSLNIIVDFYL